MSHIPQPFFAFVDLFVGGYNLTPVPPKYLLNFTHERTMTDEANNFSITLYDETALELEYVITTGSRDVLFRYGYVDGHASELYSGMILDYGLSFEQGAAVLNVTGTSNVMRSHAKKATRSFKNKTIDQIVTELAKLEGWDIGYIEPCVPIKGFYDEASTKEVHKTFQQLNISTPKFIKEELAPYAVSAKTGESGFKLYFKDTASGVKVYFTPPNFNQRPKDNNNFLYDMYQTGRGRIKTFSPQVQGSVIIAGGGTAVAQGFDPLTGELIEAKHTDSTNPNQINTNSKSVIAYETGKTPINISSASKKEMEARLASLWYNAANLAYPASMNIVGDPTLEPNTTCNITIITRKGTPHHTSGLYLITKITDQISGGDYDTQVELIKNAIAIGTYSKGGRDVNE